MKASVLQPQVVWKDLLPLSTREIANELLISMPWLVSSIYFYHRGWFLLGMVCSFYFFLTGLRQSHGAQHFSMGISRVAHHLVLFTLSVLMMTSMHAVQTSHLNHHRHCLEEQDHEGSVAKLRWWQALAAGPLFVVRMHQAAWRIASPQNRKWMGAELIAIAIVGACALSLVPAPAFGVHVAAMGIGECFTAFFAVWIVHHDCEERSGRTQRGEWINRLSYNMFFHMEHHLYPAVPTAHLHHLAARLDAIARTRNKEVLSMGFHWLKPSSLPSLPLALACPL
jgi:fatty acid desaturase